MEVNLWLFPVIFMVHEMEEIVGFRVWFEKNLDLIEKYSIFENCIETSVLKGLRLRFLKNT